ncbi:MAG TPA: hypothetical protein VM734_16220 [Kofleriaceae bacterium]|nr:hypothetical protein [Kofleriaceae bacterium]
MFRFALTLVAALPLLACASDPPRFIDAGPPPPIDASVDAPIDAAVAPPGREVTSGGGRLRGARFVVDVQVGHGTAQSPAAGTGHVVEGNAPIKP